MNLHLQFPPTPENAAKHAQIAVDAAWNVQRIKLDYSPQSLENVNHAIGGFHVRGVRNDHIQMLVFCFGCYSGEVLVRHHGAVWKLPTEADLPEGLKDGNDLMVVVLPNGNVWNPIGKAFKVLELGEAESLANSYHIATANKG
jgi:hypothetical protein